MYSALYPQNIPKMAFPINTGFQNVPPFVVNEFIEHPDVGNTSNITIKKMGPKMTLLPQIAQIWSP